ncbi:c-type cytochrome biogenesis protein CcmI [Falsiroseomonas bella]|uniref:C-type cytochrome biogenesis protein CcmI n=1 Tax=Falsiroseomonas bella TaxID=2184016 RepID=A0A317FLE4_9PROT|nr:c-type cytochrome biogenesis protein CcmI [Falsiroseomonas bella]PWS38789.1 c-type cytochrome biogenesis protein CcmI [Falsiroseomonas bella]
MTIWILMGALALLAMLPLVVMLLRPARARGRAEADLALYRAQLAELDRERETGRLDEAAHAAATLEVQRRILAAPKDDAAGAGKRSAAFLAAALFLVPAAAMGLYLVRGIPDMPSAPYDLRRQQAEAEEQLLTALRARIAQFDPGSEQARQGFILLGNAERNRGRNAEALQAWTRALAVRFEPQLAADIAEVQMEEGNFNEASALLARALAQQPQDIRLRFMTGLVEERAGRPANARRVWQSIVDEAPPGAPWREMMERRIQRLP